VKLACDPSGARLLGAQQPRSRACAVPFGVAGALLGLDLEVMSAATTGLRRRCRPRGIRPERAAQPEADGVSLRIWCRNGLERLRRRELLELFCEQGRTSSWAGIPEKTRSARIVRDVRRKTPLEKVIGNPGVNRQMISFWSSTPRGSSSVRGRAARPDPRFCEQGWPVRRSLEVQPQRQGVLFASQPFS